MTFKSSFIGATFFSLVNILNANASPNLTTSGLSSGAYMATQLMVAYSDLFDGAASLSGGIYYCAKGDLGRAQGECMKTPMNIRSEEFVDYARQLSQNQSIAALSNLKDKPIYIFHGTEDSAVHPTASIKLKEFFDAFDADVTLENSVPAGHAFISPWARNDCAKTMFPWLNRCKVGDSYFDTAGAIFKKFYKNVKQPVPPILSNLSKLAQIESAEDNISIAKNATLYVPEGCKADRTRCSWHIAFHGCLQNEDIVRNDFFIKTGYAGWAEANNVVVLFPSASSSTGNPYGCWDWWGYTNPETYATRESQQMKSVLQLLSAAGYPLPL